MKPVCVPCRLFFKPKKNGVCFEEGRPLGKPQADGSPATWGPYKLWVGDLYECRGCGAQTIVGVGQHQIAEHYQRDYAAIAARHAPLLRVDDC